MNSTNHKAFIRSAFLFFVVSLLSACGGGDGDKPQKTSPPVDNPSQKNDPQPEVIMAVISGTAAIGKAISNENVVAKCQNSIGFSQTVTTNAEGAFSGEVPQDALPCALRVKSNQLETFIHGFASQAGTNNITPLTDIVIALATTTIPTDWFNVEQPIDITDEINKAVDKVVNALSLVDYNIPSDNFSPFNDQFVIGDSADKLLDQMQGALGASDIVSYSDLVTLIKDGNLDSIPPSVEVGSGGGGTGGGNTGGGSTGGGSTGGGSTGGGSTGGGVVGSGSASQCWPGIEAITKTNTMQITVVSKDSNGILSRGVTEVKSEGLVNFKGRQLLKGVSKSVSYDSNGVNITTDPSAISTSYSFISEDKLTIALAYIESESDSQSSFIELTSDYEFNGAIYYSNFGLGVGESFSQSVTTKSTQTFTNADGEPEVFVNSVTVEHTTTFKGIEKITIGIGTFDACRFDLISSTIDPINPENNTTSKSTNWLMVGTGYSLKQSFEDGSYESEVESIYIDGKKVLGK